MVLSITHSPLFVGVFVAILALVDGNRFLDSLVEPCHHTFADGSSFDLRPLARTPGRDDYVTEDTDGRTFFLNVCTNVQQIPEECRALGKLMRSPGYVVKKNSYCHWLGSLDQIEWELIDESNPNLGVSLRYFQGEKCASNAFRQIQFQFFCDPLGQMGGVDKFLVEEIEELCLYRVTFPSKYGCPKRTSMSPIFSWFLIFLLGLGAYFTVGIAWNVKFNGCELGVDALPHKHFWLNLFDTIKEHIDSFRSQMNTRRAPQDHRHATPFSAVGVSADEKEFDDLNQYEWGS